MTNSLIFPRTILAPGSVSFKPRGLNIVGPPGFSGQSQVAEVDSGYWIAGYSAVSLVSTQQLLTYRGLSFSLKGAFNPILVPVYDYGQAPWEMNGGTPIMSVPDSACDDDEVCDDGEGFENLAIGISLSNNVEAGDNMIPLTIETSVRPRSGQFFSIRERLHIILRSLDVATDEMRVIIWPPLREDTLSGHYLDFDHPVCKMRLPDESGADLTLPLMWQGRPDMVFVEDLS